jgi:hypothetical protein
MPTFLKCVIKKLQSFSLFLAHEPQYSEFTVGWMHANFLKICTQQVIKLFLVHEPQFSESSVEAASKQSVRAYYFLV